MAIIHIAKNAGFCFGCQRATSLAEKALDQEGKLFTMGQLVHNETYLAYLQSRGVEELDGIDFSPLYQACQTYTLVTVLIRAHGEKIPVLEKLEEIQSQYPNLEILDGTCPFVDKLRKIAKEAGEQGRTLLLMGKENHPEVQGVISGCVGEHYVFANENELKTLVQKWTEEKLKTLPISMVAQTTMNVKEWKKSCAFIQNLCTNVRIFDTICSVTENRQAESEALAKTSDVVLVIGSHTSSNTMKLYDLCLNACSRTYLIETVEDAKKIIVSSTDKVSITAGASTPSSLIQEVKQTMSETMENFEELLEQSLKTLNTGDIVDGVVTSVSGNEVHLDLGAKTTGIIVREKLTDDPSAKLSDLFKIGDIIKAKVVKVSDIDGIATLDKLRADSEANWVNVVAAADSGEILSGKVIEVAKGGVVISASGVKVFVPASHTGIAKDGDLNVLLGTEQKFKVIEIKKDRKKALGSIRLVRQAERRAKEKEFWDSIEEGKVYEGAVKSLTAYGAFVDLGGVDGMVHVTELSWKHIHNPAEVVKVGDVLKVFVKSFDREKGRISLGYKTPESDPWFIFRQKYNEGDVATVKIVSLTAYGAFAEIVNGVDGLIHISQIADHKISAPSEILSVGQEVDAKITAIDEEKRKVSLSIRALIEQVMAEEAASAEVEAPASFSTDNPDALASFDSENK